MSKGNVYFKGQNVGGFQSSPVDGSMQYKHTHETITEVEVEKGFEKLSLVLLTC